MGLIQALYLLLRATVISRATLHRIRTSQPPSQTWRMFLANHVQDIVAIDFFTVPTLTSSHMACFLPAHTATPA